MSASKRKWKPGDKARQQDPPANISSSKPFGNSRFTETTAKPTSIYHSRPANRSTATSCRPIPVASGGDEGGSPSDQEMKDREGPLGEFNGVRIHETTEGGASMRAFSWIFPTAFPSIYNTIPSPFAQSH